MAIAVAGLDPAHIVGQGFDGVGNVSGKGTHRSTVSAAVYVHCKNHALNLAIVHSTKVRDVCN